MNIRLLRKLKFYKKQIHYTNTKDGIPLFTSVSDSMIIKIASECADAVHATLDQVYQSPWDNGVMISIWATKKQFLKFVTMVTTELDIYIKGVEF